MNLNAHTATDEVATTPTMSKRLPNLYATGEMKMIVWNMADIAEWVAMTKENNATQSNKHARPVTTGNFCISTASPL